jgi:hypothetical protein
MPKASYLIDYLAEKHGDLHAVIPKLAAEKGQSGAAEELGVSQYTISTWLSENGYVLVKKYVRKEETEKAAS